MIPPINYDKTNPKKSLININHSHSPPLPPSLPHLPIFMYLYFFIIKKISLVKPLGDHQKQSMTGGARMVFFAMHD